MPKKVTIVEVSLRDGLQNESVDLSIEERADLARRLAKAGITRLELGAFVRTDRIPQMKGTRELVQKIMPEWDQKMRPSVLVPNERGMVDALATSIKEIALFMACSETFSQKNINCSIEESFERSLSVIKMAKKHKIKIRGYLSTCFGCPYEGKVKEEKVVTLAQRLLSLGCFEVSIGDTIGVATPLQIESVFTKLKKKVPVHRLAGHFHDTRGTAVANVAAAVRLGVRVFDSSLGGLGGCPYAPGAAGNVATEDLVYMLHGMKIKTGLDLDALVDASRYLSRLIKKPLPSRLAQAGPWETV